MTHDINLTFYFFLFQPPAGPGYPPSAPPSGHYPPNGYPGYGAPPPRGHGPPRPQGSFG